MRVWQGSSVAGVARLMGRVLLLGFGLSVSAGVVRLLIGVLA